MKKTRRCDGCAFWALGEQWTPLESQEGQHADDRLGTCHRHAPRPPTGDFEYEVLKHLTMISWDHATAGQQEDNFKNWEEAYLQETSWPTTTGADWCGEWQDKHHGDFALNRV
jgi:hypothetical protein